MGLDEAIKRYTNNAKYERIHGNLQGCLEFKQLAEWLKDYKRLKEQEPCEDAISRQAVLEYIEGSEAELGHSSENELVCQYIKELPPVTLKLCDEREQGKCPFYAN